MKTKIEADKITKYIICAVFALILLAIFVPLFANILGFGYELEQLKNSLTKGYCYAKDDTPGTNVGGEKVIYHGTLKELASKDKKQYTIFMDFAQWYVDYEANERITVGRVECEDYIVAHRGDNYYGGQRWESFYLSIPENVTYYGSADEYDVEFLVFNQNTDEVLAFDSWSAVNKWLGVS